LGHPLLAVGLPLITAKLLEGLAVREAKTGGQPRLPKVMLPSSARCSPDEGLPGAGDTG